MILNRQALAEAMGVTPPTVDRWIRDGMPVRQKGSKGVAWEFELAAVMAWWRDREQAQVSENAPTSMHELELRKLAAEAGIAELKLAQAKADVAPIEEFERTQQKVMGIIRANILNVPARAVLQLLGETNEVIFKTKLRAELVLALTQAAEADLEDAEEEDAE